MVAVTPSSKRGKPPARQGGRYSKQERTLDVPSAFPQRHETAKQFQLVTSPSDSTRGLCHILIENIIGACHLQPLRQNTMIRKKKNWAELHRRWKKQFESSRLDFLFNLFCYKVIERVPVGGLFIDDGPEVAKDAFDISMVALGLKRASLGSRPISCMYSAKILYHTRGDHLRSFSALLTLHTGSGCFRDVSRLNSFVPNVVGENWIWDVFTSFQHLNGSYRGGKPGNQTSAMGVLALE